MCRYWSASSLFSWSVHTLLGPATFVVLSCSEPFDETRRVPERGTFGEEVYRLFHRDLAHEAPLRARGFELAHDRFVETLDHFFPESELKDTQEFFLRLLALQDDGTLPKFTRKIAGTLVRLNEDDAALRALAVLSNRVGYVSLEHEYALSQRVAGYPRYRELATSLIDFVRAHDGLDDEGRRAPQEDDSLSRLLGAFSEELATLEISMDTQRTIALTADLVLSEDPRFSAGAVTEPRSSAGVVMRDIRGMAMPAPSGSHVAEPFSDVAPADGLADVDEAGRFVDGNRNPIDIPPYGLAAPLASVELVRDARGRAVSTGGNALFRYVELDRSLLAGALRDTRDLIADDVPKKTKRLFERFLGPRDGNGLYRAADNRLVDLAFGVAHSVNIDALADVFELGSTLVENHESSIAYLVQETSTQFDIAEKYDVALALNNTFLDDTLRWVRKILEEPGLAEDLLEAIEDPAILRLPEAMAKLAGYKHAKITEQDWRNGRVFVTPVDHTKPDTRDNASLHQRVLHLLFDTRGARYEPRFMGMPLGFVFKIEDQAEFFLLSLIGEAEVPALVSSLTGLSQHPTPEELAVFLNHPQEYGDPKGKEGIEVRNNDGDALYAAVESGIVDGLRPLVRVFFAHRRLDLLFELFEVLHLHWASPEGHDYQNTSRSDRRFSYLSGLRRYQPLLIDAVTNAHVFDAVRNLLIETKSLRTRAGNKDARQVLLAFAEKVLNKDPSLKTRAGGREVIVDGLRISPLAPIDLVRAGLADVAAVTRRSNLAQKDWDDLVDTAHRLFLATERTGDFSAKFSNPRLKPLAKVVLGFLAERAQQHRRVGDIQGWPMRTLVDGMNDLIESNELPALFDLWAAVDADANLSAMLVELRDELFKEAGGFSDLLAILGNGVSAAKDASLGVPLLRFVGREMHPDTGLPFDVTDFVRRTLLVDPAKNILNTGHRAIELTSDGRMYVDGVLDAVKQTNRIDPTNEGSLDGADFKAICAIAAHYLLDPDHGLERFYMLVRNR